MKIGVIGNGSVGSALGARLAERGHAVVYGSRDPSERAGTVTHRDAVTESDIVITAIPGSAVMATLEAIGEDVLAGKIVLDPSVPISPEMTLLHPNDSLARHVQERFPQTRVVKTLNTMNTSVMIDPLDTVSHATVFVSGDDADAKSAVGVLLGDLGWSEANILDLGGIETATSTEHAALLFFAVFGALQTPVFDIAITR